MQGIEGYVWVRVAGGGVMYTRDRVMKKDIDGHIGREMQKDRN